VTPAKLLINRTFADSTARPALHCKWFTDASNERLGRHLLKIGWVSACLPVGLLAIESMLLRVEAVGDR
jgi:hypothetical protein